MAYANNTYNQLNAITYLYELKNNIDISDVNTYLYNVSADRYKEIDFIILIYIHICCMIGRMTHFQVRFYIAKLKVGTGSLLDLLIRHNRGFTPGDDSIENPSLNFERIEKPLYSSCILSFYT